MRSAAAATIAALLDGPAQRSYLAIADAQSRTRQTTRRALSSTVLLFVSDKIFYP